MVCHNRRTAPRLPSSFLKFKACLRHSHQHSPNFNAQVAWWFCQNKNKCHHLWSLRYLWQHYKHMNKNKEMVQSTHMTTNSKMILIPADSSSYILCNPSIKWLSYRTSTMWSARQGRRFCLLRHCLVVTSRTGTWQVLVLAPPQKTLANSQSFPKKCWKAT